MARPPWNRPAASRVDSPEREAPVPNDKQKPSDEVLPGTPQAGEHICRRCNGRGRLNEGPCPTCRGTGKITAPIGDA
jgi:hypothetical protein